jgi:hypothetical protein
MHVAFNLYSFFFRTLIFFSSLLNLFLSFKALKIINECENPHNVLNAKE